MAFSRLRRVLEYLLSFGAYPGESDTQRGKRRILVGAIRLATAGTVPSVFVDFGAGDTWVAVGSLVAAVSGVVALVAMRLRPDRFAVTST